MAGRRGGKSLDPETALSIALNGTALRLVDPRAPTLDAITQLREIAGDRTDMLAKEAGSMIGGYLGHPLSSPQAIAAAYLLILAGNGHHHDALVVAADDARRDIGGSAYSL